MQRIYPRLAAALVLALVALALCAPLAGAVGSDWDADGLPNALDNCLKQANPDQRDMDGDDKGDVCDSDRDGDGQQNASDPCPDDALNACVTPPLPPPDSDGDGVTDAQDRCPSVAGPASNRGCPLEEPPPPSGGISLGVYQGSFYGQGNTSGMDAEAQLIGRYPNVFMWYPNASQQWPFETAKANYAHSRGADIHLTWEWFNVPYTDITSGRYDAYIRQYARDSAAYGHPILMRMFHEMNGNWYSWSLTSDTVADQHKAAWIHIVNIFRQEGATNVKFFWCPNNGGAYDFRLTRAWPGDAYVDVVGVDSYHGPPSWSSGSAEAMFRPKYNYFYQTLGSTRPFAIGETGARETTSYPGGKAQWVRDVMNQLTNGSWPMLTHVTIFDDNFSGYTDWRVNSSSASLAAYREVAADARYQGTLP